jgi:hypothetical protein
VLKKLSSTPWRRMGEWIHRSRFLDLGTSWRWLASFTPLSLYPPVSIGEEVGWTPESAWTIWRSENSWPCRDSNSDPSVVQPLASHYTDYATETHMQELCKIIFLSDILSADSHETLRGAACFRGTQLFSFLTSAVGRPVVFNLFCSRTPKCNL